MWRFLGAVAVLFLLALGVLWLAKIGPFAPAEAGAGEGPDSLTGLGPTPAMEAQDQGASRRGGALKVLQPFKDPINIGGAVITLVEDAEIASRYDGRVSEILVELNQPVRRGAVLLRLDDQQAQLKEEAALLKANSDEKIESAKAKYETSSQIVKDDIRAGGSVSGNDKLIHEFQMKTALYDWKTALLEREVARKEHLTAQLERNYHRITSTVSGTIAKSYKKVGESVQAGQPVFRVANYDRLRVEGLVPAQQAPYIKVGMRCLVHPERLLDPEKELRGHTGPITCLAVTPDQLLLASASEDQTVLLWDWGRGRRWDTLPDDVPLYAVAAGKPVKDEASGETTYTFVTGGANGRVRLWKVVANAQGQRVSRKSFEVSHADAHRGGVIRAIAFSPDGTTFATGGDRTLCIWKLNGDQAEFKFKVQETPTEPAHRGTITTLNFSQDEKGNLYLVSAGTDRSLKRWKLDTNVAQLDFRQRDRTNDVPHLGVTQDGKRCLFDSGDKLWILDFDERDIVGTIDSVGTIDRGGRGHFGSLALFSPSGQMVLTANAAGRLQLYSVPVSPHEAAFFRDAYAEGFRRNSLLALGALGACASEDSLLMVPGALASCLEQPKQAPPPEVSSAVPTLNSAAQLQFPVILVNTRDFRGLTAVPQVWPLQGAELRHLVTPDAAATTCAAFVPEAVGHEGESWLFTAGADKLIRVWRLPPASERANALEAIVTAVGNQVESGTPFVRIRAEFDNPNVEGARLYAGSNVNLTIYPELAEKK